MDKIKYIVVDMLLDDICLFEFCFWLIFGSC